MNELFYKERDLSNAGHGKPPLNVYGRVNREVSFYCNITQGLEINAVASTLLNTRLIVFISHPIKLTYMDLQTDLQFRILYICIYN